MKRLPRALIAAILLIGLVGTAQAAVVRVQPGESISAAIRAARPGDTLRIERGDYADHLLIDKPLTLEGINRPTLSGSNTGDVIRVQAKDVTIRGMILRDSGTNLGAENSGVHVMPGSDRVVIRDCDLTYDLFGVWLENSADAKIIHNTITGKRDLLSAERGNGIQVYNDARTQVIDNEISFTRDGLYVDWSHDALFRGNRIHNLRYGTHYMNTNNSVWEDNQSYLNRSGLALMMVKHLTVRHNIAWGNTDHGIMLRTMQDSDIEDNIVAGNGRGFFIYDAEYNRLRRNLIVNNRIGIHLAASAHHNDVDENDIINNEQQVKFVAADDTVWGQHQGNYWSNYTGWDQNGDGIGDVPYVANDLVDRLSWQYPLMKLLLTSPALQTLRFVARQFPILRAPSIVDKHPRMRPIHTDWSKWNDKQPRD